MTAAIEVVHSILTQDFGFEHILWIFSGRRGVHWSENAQHTNVFSERNGQSDQRRDVVPHISFLRLCVCALPSWICDSRARKLTMEQRSAIVDFLSVYQGKDKKVVMQSAVHPSLQRAYNQLLPHFEELLETQGWFDTKESSDKMLEFLDPCQTQARVEDSSYRGNKAMEPLCCSQEFGANLYFFSAFVSPSDSSRISMGR
jgi:DNA primase small subunit